MPQFNTKKFTIEELAEEIQQYATAIKTDASVVITHTKSDAGAIGLIDITVSLLTVTQIMRAIRFMLYGNKIQGVIVSNDDDMYALPDRFQPVAVWDHIHDFVESCEQAELATFIDYVQPDIHVTR